MKNESNESMTIEVKTPDGVLYYILCEDEDGQLNKVISIFGKAGTALAAWAFATDCLVNMLLERKVGVNEIIERLSNISNSKPIRTATGVKVGSGPEGLVVALLEYKRQKFRDLKSKFEGMI
jgi:hypothetical protein